MSFSPDFVPEGCEAGAVGQPAVTLGAGVQWFQAYAFAQERNVTLVGGELSCVLTPLGLLAPYSFRLMPLVRAPSNPMWRGWLVLCCRDTTFALSKCLPAS